MKLETVCRCHAANNAHGKKRENGSGTLGAGGGGRVGVKASMYLQHTRVNKAVAVNGGGRGGLGKIHETSQGVRNTNVPSDWRG